MAWARCIPILICFFVCVSTDDSLDTDYSNTVFHNEFAVHIPSGDIVANEIAKKYGYTNIGQIGDLSNYYLFRHQRIRKRSITPSQDHRNQLSLDPQVKWVEQQVEKRRVKRDPFGDGAEQDITPNQFSSVNDGASLSRSPRQIFGDPFSNFGRFIFRSPTVVRPRGSQRFPDPYFEHQWYLSRGAVGGYDMNVTAAWSQGYTGKGVVISILDDGIQHNHPDLAQNYDPLASVDINDNDPDPMPQDNGDNKHGTRCAGEVASVAFNEYCGVGIAYNASIGGVRMLDGTVNDAVEARAISLNPDHVDIYSASWGPEDDGKTVDGPGPLAKRAFINGVIRGRHGKGSIFVWASGNGGRHTDNCNCDGYTNSIFTLSISSASQRGLKPWYLEECSSTLASTYSSGTPGLDHSVATADMDGRRRPERLCTLEHTGTSASAPLAAGLCALALEANPDLTWRDMQHIVVRTSRRDPLMKEEGWFVNAVGRYVSHKFGYGLMDAGAMVSMAERWKTVPEQHVCQTIINRTDLTIPTIQGSSIQAKITTDGCAGTSGEVRYLEHVQAVVALRFIPRGNINIKLISPSGTASTLLFERPRDVLSEKFDDWPFLSVHFWGEKAAGTWRLVVTNGGTRPSTHPGVLSHWQLILHGTKENPENIGFPVSSFSHLSPTFNQFGDLIFSGSVSHGVFEPLTKSSPSQNLQEVEANSRKNFSGIFHDGFCHSECLGGCSGTGPQNCKSCMHFSLQGECVSNCPEGTFASEDKNCLPCHGSCGQCLGPRQNQCQSCPPQSLFVAHMGICVESCPRGFFAENGSCLPCENQCSECQSADWCTLCDHNLLLLNGSCHVACPSRTYETNVNSCDSCDASCKTCIGKEASDCASCHSPFFMSSGKCVLSCPRGTYGDLSTGSCIPCPMGCSTCDSAMCTSCVVGWRLKSGLCVAFRPKNCKINQFRSGDVCYNCDVSCLNCIGPSDSECLHCKTPLVLMNAQCMPSCPKGHFPFKSRCLPCPYGCSSCDSFNRCTSCSVKFYLHRSRCLASCPPNYYSDRGQCVNCDPSCGDCWGPRGDQCFSCPTGALLLQSTCRTKCPDGYFRDKGTCLPCYHNCRTCKGLGLHSCTSCPEYLTLDGGMCLECSAGRYYNTSLRTCVSCHESCLTCNGIGPSSCTSCQAPFSIHPSTRSCRTCCSSATMDEEEHHCCHCNPDTGNCLGSGTTDKRRIAMSLHSGKEDEASSVLSSTTAVVLLVCLANLLVFGVVFGILQSKSSSKRRRGSRSYSYHRLPLQLSSPGASISPSFTSLPVPMSGVTGSLEEEEEEDEFDYLFTRT